MKVRGLSHYKQLNFDGGSDWMGATAAALMGTTHAGDKNNLALKSQVLPQDELPLVFPWKFRNLGSVLSYVKNLQTVSSYAKMSVVWYMTIGKVMRYKHLL